MAQTEETTNKLIGTLIEVLHGQYEDTRQLAVVQLVLLGNKSVKPLLAYLDKEEVMQMELESMTINRGGLSGDPQHEPAWIAFKNKWGHFPDDYVAGAIADARQNALEGAMKSLGLLGVADANERITKLLKKIKAFCDNNTWYPN